MSPSFSIINLGCPKNLVDAERLAAALEGAGYRLEIDPARAELILVNTCGFIEQARQESLDTIAEMMQHRLAGRCRGLVVTGCLSQRYPRSLWEQLPAVDAFLGIGGQDDIVTVCGRILDGGDQRPCLVHDPDKLVEEIIPRKQLTVPHSAYLKIADGCDNRCAYCAIPLIRGPLRSRPADELLDEARYLAGSGVRELNVIAQDTTAYGTDTAGEPRLHALLRDLCAVDGLEWVRLLYAHPAHFYDELIEVLADEPKLCPYVDLPLQHVSDRLLKAMGRRVTRARIEALVEELRDAVPDVTLRTTFITGLPGESEEEFEELLDFVQEQRFDRVGCFAYSPEEDTPAAAMPDQVPTEAAEERRDLLMAAQAEIAMDLAAARVGERAHVLIEPTEAGAEDVYPARSQHEAPDVDPLIYVTSTRALKAGDFVDVEIVGAEGYDCVAIDLASAVDLEGDDG